MKKLQFFLVVPLLSFLFFPPLVGISAAGIKYVAVVETEVDAASGVSAEVTSAEVRQVTAELRRSAVKVLPRGQYNVMTTETVYAQGGAVLEECAEENCVITLGSKIGADYIVRGTLSKIQTLFTLSVEIYETNDGNLVGSSDPVRAENIRELVEKAGETCSAMYKTFMESQNLTPTPPPALPADEPPPPPPTPTLPSVAQEPDTDSPLRKLQRMGIDISVGAGGVIAGGYGGGIEWATGERVTMPYSASGAYLFLDGVYAELSLGYSAGDGTWESENAPNQQDLPNMPRSYINIGALAKYPFVLDERVKFFPLLGIEYDACVSGKVKYKNGGGEYALDGTNDRPEASALSSAWFKLGAGIDFGLGKIVYLRAELIYGLRAANDFEEYCADKTPYNVNATGGDGVAFKIGIGVKL